jgi:hypothetical protein
VLNQLSTTPWRQYGEAEVTGQLHAL